MGSIYACAHLTLIAAVGNSPAYGLPNSATVNFQPRSCAPQYPCIFIDQSQDPVYNIRGVPFVVSEREDASTLRIALNWYTMGWAPQERRIGFPSWSVLGWKGKRIMHRLPYVSTEVFSVEIWDVDQFRDLGRLVSTSTGLTRPPYDSHSLRLTGYILRIYKKEMISVTSSASFDVRVNDKHSVRIVPVWNTGSNDEGREATVDVFCSDEPATRLLLKACGDHYERVGSFDAHVVTKAGGYIPLRRRHNWHAQSGAFNALMSRERLECPTLV